MKVLAATLFVIMLAANTSLAAESLPSAENDRTKAAQAANAETTRVVEPQAAQPTTSALDLSLFGIITLGVIGLFWIRRHTSEL